MTIPGRKVDIDLGDDTLGNTASLSVTSGDSFGFIKDVQERSPATPTAPKPPTPRNTRGGFPAHGKRIAQQSRFKSSRAGTSESSQRSSLPSANPAPTDFSEDISTIDDGDNGDFMVTERRRIDEENRKTLNEMSAEDIERERQELMESLDPSLIERLLRRANIDQPEEPTDFPGLQEAKRDESSRSTQPKKPRKTVTFAEEEDIDDVDRLAKDQTTTTSHPGRAGPPHSSELSSQDSVDNVTPEGTIHFPRPPQPPELDPSSSTFLTDLHEKYFPTLPAEPEKLEWMSSSKSRTSYSSSQSGLDPKDIRFDFVGSLIPPNLAAQIPVTAGLHHHGDAPDAAGYTIPELAMLARSSVPAQRCIAFRTLGRILYRLGKGEFGDPGDGGQGLVGAEDTLGELARGLWSEVEKEGVIEIAVAESEGQGVAGGRHLSAKAYATEAVWLWQKGGGRRMKAA